MQANLYDERGVCSFAPRHRLREHAGFEANVVSLPCRLRGFFGEHASGEKRRSRLEQDGEARFTERLFGHVEDVGEIVEKRLVMLVGARARARANMDCSRVSHRIGRDVGRRAHDRRAERAR